MPASVQIVEKNGAGGSATDKTSGTIRFKNADDATVNTANPMVKPPSGSDWSFEKWLRFKVDSGTYTEITNVKAYMDGGNGWTGVNLWWKAVENFATPAEGTSSSGYTDAFSYTSGAALTLGAGPYTGSGEKADHLVALMQVTDAASGGVLASETITMAWDEI